MHFKLKMKDADIRRFQQCEPGSFIDIWFGEVGQDKFVADRHAMLSVGKIMPQNSENVGKIHRVIGTIAEGTELRKVAVTSYENYASGTVIMRYL